MTERSLEGITVGVSPIGRPRGRPKKLTSSPSKPRPRGRPSIDIRDDPDRYAVVVMQALQSVYDMRERRASLAAVKLVGAVGKPETIRFKARKALFEKQRAIEKSAHNGDVLTGRQFQKIRARQRWLENLATAATLAINPTNLYTEQLVKRIRKLSQLAGETRFSRDVLEHLLALSPRTKLKIIRISDT
jgi:hypothetical protein